MDRHRVCVCPGPSAVIEAGFGVLQEHSRLGTDDELAQESG